MSQAFLVILNCITKPSTPNRQTDGRTEIQTLRTKWTQWAPSENGSEGWFIYCIFDSLVAPPTCSYAGDDVLLSSAWIDVLGRKQADRPWPLSSTAAAPIRTAFWVITVSSSSRVPAFCGRNPSLSFNFLLGWGRPADTRQARAGVRRGGTQRTAKERFLLN